MINTHLHSSTHLHGHTLIPMSMHSSTHVDTHHIRGLVIRSDDSCVVVWLDDPVTAWIEVEDSSYIIITTLLVAEDPDDHHLELLVDLTSWYV